MIAILYDVGMERRLYVHEQIVSAYTSEDRASLLKGYITTGITFDFSFRSSS